MKAPPQTIFDSEAPRAPARGICGKAKRNSAEATRLRPTGYAAVACRHFIGPKPLAKADPPLASTRGILAKASERSYDKFICTIVETQLPIQMLKGSRN